ncbi:MAG TPA: tRNA (adenosine(37)-N6)-threonylcarbamoyltransferase complex ATPase subunit type 1 TsaE [Synergistaceae bacterium]|nr:tRNA (adenosine(37)-N6)-threonylcarbamoyltransferase complex ATPase subunit type 1 TsaE [Synergistaceae bacterium]
MTTLRNDLELKKVKDGFCYVSRGPEETRRLASVLSKYSFPGLVILLSGTLGAGKTEFVRGFASGSGWEDARSPSFTIINEYRASTPITHVDLYRVERNASMEFSLEEFSRDGSIVLVEWPENWDGERPSDVWKIVFSVPEDLKSGRGDQNLRFLEVLCEGVRACEMLERFMLGAGCELEEAGR